VEQDEYGRPEMPVAGSEVETLLGFLDYQRATLAGSAPASTTTSYDKRCTRPH